LTSIKDTSNPRSGDENAYSYPYYITDEDEKFENTKIYSAENGELASNTPEGGGGEFGFERTSRHTENYFSGYRPYTRVHLCAYL
jgi:hypothetical protein